MIDIGCIEVCGVVAEHWCCPGMSGEDTTHRKRNNYKLLVDPELQKGHKKLYRINGAIPGVSRWSPIRIMLISL